MATTTSATDEVAAAEAQLAALKARTGAGDGPPVTLDDLRHAEAVLRFAVWQRDAMAEAEAKRLEQERLAQIETLRAELPQRLAEAEARLAEKRAVMRAAIMAYVGEALSHNGALADLVAELQELGPLPQGLASGPYVGGLTAGPTYYRQAPIQRAIAEEATAVINQLMPRAQIDLNRPQD